MTNQCGSDQHNFGEPPIQDDARCLKCDVPVMTGALLDLEWTQPNVQSLNEQGARP